MPSPNATFNHKFADIFRAKPISIKIQFQLGRRLYLIFQGNNVKVFIARQNQSLQSPRGFLYDTDARFANLNDNRNLN